MYRYLIAALGAALAAKAYAECSIYPAPVSEDPECMTQFWMNEVDNTDPEGQLEERNIDFSMCYPSRTGASVPLPSIPVNDGGAVQYHPQQLNEAYFIDIDGDLLYSVDIAGGRGTASAESGIPGVLKYASGDLAAPVLYRIDSGKLVEIGGIAGQVTGENGSGYGRRIHYSALSDSDGLFAINDQGSVRVFRRDTVDADQWLVEATIPEPAGFAALDIAYDPTNDLLFVAYLPISGQSIDGKVASYKHNGGGSWSYMSEAISTRMLDDADGRTEFGDSIAAKDGQLLVTAQSYNTTSPYGAFMVFHYNPTGIITSPASFFDTGNDGKGAEPAANYHLGRGGAGFLENGDIWVGARYSIFIYRQGSGALDNNTPVQEINLRGLAGDGVRHLQKGGGIYLAGVMARETPDTAGPGVYSRVILSPQNRYILDGHLSPSWATPEIAANPMVQSVPIGQRSLINITKWGGAASTSTPHAGLSAYPVDLVRHFDYDTESMPGCEETVVPPAVTMAMSLGAEPDGYCGFKQISTDPDCLGSAVDAGLVWAINRAGLITSGYDADGDIWPNDYDNCPFDPNPDQANMDGDEEGDACDGDIDGDGEPNGSDETPNGDEAAAYDEALDNALTAAAPYLNGADQDADGDFDRNDLDLLLGLEFDNYRPMFGDGSSSAPRDQMLYLAGNRLINILNRISEGDAPGAIVEGAQTYLEVMASAFGTSGGRNELLRAPGETVITTLNGD